MNDAPSPFIEGTHIQFAWDATSLSLLKVCPRKYYYTMIEGWRPKGDSIHLRFGILVHSGLELYDKRRCEGMDHDEALDFVVDYLLKQTWEVREDYEGPWETGDPNKNRDNLLRSVIWYLEHYKDDPAKTLILANGKPAVELSFKFETPHLDPTGSPYLYCGHMDRMVDYDGNLFVMDRKTTKNTPGSYYFNQFNPDTQMSGYTLAGKVVFDVPISGVIIDAIQVAVGFTNFARGFTQRSDGLLSEWLDNTGDWFKLQQRYAETNVWPMNEASCNNYGGCPFRDVCSKDPSVREIFLNSAFEKHAWNPLEER